MALSRRTVLVTRSLGLGDFCTAVPALRGLRRAFPDDRLVLAAPAWQWPLARRVGVDEMVAVDGLMPLPSRFADADLAVNLHGSGPESIHRLVALRPRELLTFRHPAVRASARGPRWSASEHDVDRWCRLVGGLGVTTDRCDVRIEVDGPTVDAGVRHVVVHPGAGAPARRWPPERFAQVVRHLVARDIPVVVTGAAVERTLCRRVVTDARCDPASVRVVAGQTDLAALAAIVASARAVVSNDTGVAHLAAAFATPLLVLFGPSHPARWGPVPTGPQELIWKGRVGDPNGRRLDPGLERIGTGEVIAALEALLTRAPPRTS